MVLVAATNIKMHAITATAKSLLLQFCRYISIDIIGDSNTELRDLICNPYNLIEDGNGQDDFDKKASTSAMWQVVVALGTYDSTVTTAAAAVTFVSLAGTAAGAHVMMIIADWVTGDVVDSGLCILAGR